MDNLTSALSLLSIPINAGEPAAYPDQCSATAIDLHLVPDDALEDYFAWRDPFQLIEPLIKPCTGFLDLPAEIRNRIYSEILLGEEQGDLGPTHHVNDAIRELYREKRGIMQICRRIRDESLPMFYGGNCFCLDVSTALSFKTVMCWVSHIPGAPLAHIHSLLIKCKSMEVTVTISKSCGRVTAWNRKDSCKDTWLQEHVRSYLEEAMLVRRFDELVAAGLLLRACHYSYQHSKLKLNSKGFQLDLADQYGELVTQRQRKKTRAGYHQELRRPLSKWDFVHLTRWIVRGRIGMAEHEAVVRSD